MRKYYVITIHVFFLNTKNRRNGTERCNLLTTFFARFKDKNIFFMRHSFTHHMLVNHGETTLLKLEFCET